MKEWNLLALVTKEIAKRNCYDKREMQKIVSEIKPDNETKGKP